MASTSTLYVCATSNSSEKDGTSSNKMSIKAIKPEVTIIAQDTLHADMCAKRARTKVSILQAYLRKIHLQACNSDISHHQLKMGIIINSAAVNDLTRDLGEFLEILNQKQIQKEKRREFKLKKKELKKQASFKLKGQS